MPLLVGGLRILQIFARHHHPVLDHITPTVFLDSGQAFRSRRHPSRRAKIGSEINQMKSELRRFAEQTFDPIRIIDAGKLDENAILPLPLNIRLIHPRFIHAAADNLDGLIDSRAETRRNRRLARRQGDQAALVKGDDDIALPVRHDIR